MSGEPTDGESAAPVAASAAMEVVRDIFAGTVGGCSGIVAGQPLDTIKVVIQEGKGGREGALAVARRIVSTRGWRGLFAGMSAPLVGNAPMNAILFAVYGASMRWFESKKASEAGGDGDGASGSRRPDLTSVFLAGAVSGVALLPVSTPTELIKCRLQVNGKASGPLGVARDVVRRTGVLGLGRGMCISAHRDIYSFGAYFLSYEWIKQALTKEGEEASSATMLFAGGIAGQVCWGCSYPADVVKTVIQTMPPETPYRDRNLITVTRRLYAKEGAAYFTRGLGTTLVRAFPANAVTFLFYELTLKLTANVGTVAASS